MGSKIGTWKIAAKKHGMTFDEYASRINNGEKHCTKCNMWKPIEQFAKDSSRSDGYQVRCKDCDYQRTMPGPTKRERRQKLEEKLSWCSKCEKWLPVSEINGGLCRVHRAAYARNRYATNETARIQRKQHSSSRKRNLYPIPADALQDLFTEFEGKCAYCQSPATTWDHIHPVAKQGNSTPGNIVPCCASCNSSKKDQDLEEWLDKTNRHNLHPKLMDIIALSFCVPNY